LKPRGITAQALCVDQNVHPRAERAGQQFWYLDKGQNLRMGPNVIRRLLCPPSLK
jgi:hypothetical protein